MKQSVEPLERPAPVVMPWSCGCNGVQSPVHSSHVPLWAAAGRLTDWRRLSAGFRPQPDLPQSGKIPGVLGSSDSDTGLPGSLGTNPTYSKLKLIRTQQFHPERCQEATLNRTQISPWEKKMIPLKSCGRNSISLFLACIILFFYNTAALGRGVGEETLSCS